MLFNYCKSISLISIRQFNKISKIKPEIYVLADYFLGEGFELQIVNLLNPLYKL